MVYLIHLDKPYRHAQHYIGFAATEATYLRRIQHHRKGTGAAFLRAVNRAGIKWSVVREWPDEDGRFERQLKNTKHSSRLCPECNKTLSQYHVHNKQLPS